MELDHFVEKLKVYIKFHTYHEFTLLHSDQVLEDIDEFKDLYIMLMDTKEKENDEV